MTSRADTLAGLASRLLPPASAAGRKAVLAEAAAQPEAWVRDRLASVPRRVGRHLLEGPVETVLGSLVDLGSFRACDLVAAELLATAGPKLAAGPAFRDFYSHGDADEKRMILKALPLLEVPAEALRRILEEAHRTNDQTIFEAAFLDSDLAVRVLTDAGFNRLVLKTAFLDLPVRRILRFEGRRSAELARMLFDFRDERRAAGRKAWEDTDLAAG